MPGCSAYWPGLSGWEKQAKSLSALWCLMREGDASVTGATDASGHLTTGACGAGGPASGSLDHGRLAHESVHADRDPGTLSDVCRSPRASTYGAGDFWGPRRQARCPGGMPELGGRPQRAPSHGGRGGRAGAGLPQCARALVQATAAATAGAEERKAGNSCSRRLSSRSTFSSRLL